jgi:hypothetical protein
VTANIPIRCKAEKDFSKTTFGIVQPSIPHLKASGSLKAFCVGNRDRYDAVAPLIPLLGLPKNRRFPHLLPDGTCAWSMSAAASWCAQKSGRSLRTIQRVQAAFKLGGDGAFDRRFRSDRGLSRFFGRNRAAAAFAAYLSLTWRPSVRAIHEAMLRHRELLGLSGLKMPSYETVRCWLRSATPSLVPLALEGQKLYRDLAFSDADICVLTVRKDRSE